jgi:ankyrin repeat protein
VTGGGCEGGDWDVVEGVARALQDGEEVHDAWSWAEHCPLESLQALVARFPAAAHTADADGATLLDAAVRDPSGAEKVAYLLSQPAVDADARQRNGTTPLYWAALSGNVAAVRLLLARGADVNAHNDDNRWTVLMVAVAQDHADVVGELLRDRRIELNARDDRDRTALHLAAEDAAPAILAVLASRPDVDLNPKDSAGMTPISRAAFAGRVDAVGTLLARPATDPNRVDRHRRTALHIGDPRTNPAITNRPEGMTALDVARSDGRDDLTALLTTASITDEDALSAGDEWVEPPPAPPPFSERPIRPEPPRRREP